MNSKFKQKIEEVLTDYTGKEETISHTTPVGGGCINNGMTITTNNRMNFFLKYNQNSPKSMFSCEVNGLKELVKSNAVRVPSVIGIFEGSNTIPAFLILENIQTGTRRNLFYEDFGRKFARMHKYTSNRYGFYEDNYIGSTPQKNSYKDNWVDFYRENRLGYQIKLAQKKGLATKDLLDGMNTLMPKLDDIIGGINEPPAVLHGDLWGGNYMIGESGEVVLIDPAVYYGSREADLAMTSMFGGFPASFYDAYEEEYPLEKGYSERSRIYKLYHYLNHLNLFGTGYLGSCLSIIRHFV